eukprot:scaffold29886_cov128-Isochrysis_galbana.AAC.1
MKLRDAKEGRSPSEWLGDRTLEPWRRAPRSARHWEGAQSLRTSGIAPGAPPADAQPWSRSSLLHTATAKSPGSCNPQLLATNTPSTLKKKLAEPPTGLESRAPHPRLPPQDEDRSWCLPSPCHQRARRLPASAPG